jgi:tetratricopeptide (TPR) repeat protein/tRNA A-37 threonylcarbamoyl transferase component Bud32
MNSPQDGTAPGRIGPYKVLELLGQGGMGEVYLAEQSEPVRRQVAVKVIRPGMDTKAVLARFESERQALAIMDHPSIAKVLDAGTTEGGRPYFVMEYVKGVPLTDYCDLHKLSTEKRLDLFIELCQAVQHAHQKGIIHRDLKPSNVLVTVPNGHPVPKVIDFGIAKAMGYKLTELTLHTQQGQPVGTPAYMSPEQAEMTGLDVDTRTDVYALGVMLYELLVGTVPIDMRDIPATALSMALRETDPPKPSDRFDTLNDHQDRIAELRQTDPGSLRSQVRGDLDWIVMKALEKDRTRRYETVNGLVQDIRRHLRHEPVTAGQPSAGYRMRKFARRHRLGVTAGVAIAAGLIGGSVLATMGMVRARRAEQVATAEADKASAINDFLQETLGSASPWRGGQGRDVTVLEALDRAVVRIDESFDDQPLIAAALRNTIGRTYLRLAQYEEADPLLRSSLEVRRALLEDVHPDVAESLHYLGVLQQKRGMVAEADELISQALEMYRTLFHDRHASVIEALADHALVLLDQGHYDEGARVSQEVLELRCEIYGEEHFEVALSLNDLGWVHLLDGQWEEAERHLREAVAMYRRLLDEARPQEAAVIRSGLATSLANLGAALRERGELDEAEASYRQALELNRSLLGDVHPRVAENLMGLGRVVLDRGDIDEALRLSREGIDLKRQVQGENSPEVASGLLYLAVVLNRQGDHDGAAEANLEAIEIYRRLASEGNGQPDWYATTLNNMGYTLTQKGDCERASPFFEEAIEVYESMSGEDRADTANSRSHYGACLTELGRYREAEAALLAAYPVIQAQRGEEHPWTTRTADRLVALYEAWGKPEQAEPYRR